MKKNFLILISAVLGCSSAFADDANKVKLRYYEAEGNIIYDVKGCVPGSGISFYSNVSGGHLLKEMNVSTNGGVRTIWNDKSAPAFVLNGLSPNQTGVAGNGMVCFAKDKEFTINDISIVNNAGIISLKWNGAVNALSRYSFQVLKSVNGAAYESIQTVNAQSLSQMQYVFTDPTVCSKDATYELRVVDNAMEEYYTSKPLYTDRINGISVYPTVTHSDINIRLTDNTGAGEYKILNLKGQVVASGGINKATFNCSVAGLPAGNYIIDVYTQKNVTSAKFIKE